MIKNPRSMILPIIAIALIVEAAAFIFLGSYSSTRLNDEIHTQLISKIRIPGELLVNNQINYDQFTNPQFLSQITGEKTIESMIIKEDTIFYSYLPELVGQNAVDVLKRSKVSDLLDIGKGVRESKYKTVSEGQSTYLSVITPLYQGYNNIGYAYIKIDISELEKKTQTVVNAFALISFLCISLTTLALVIFIRLRVIQPLSLMVVASKKITTGDLSGSLAIRSNDELGDLALSFNQMTSQLRQSYQNLEQKVADRTAELEESKKQLEVNLSELERMNKLMIGRELRMTELKNKIEELKAKQVQPPVAPS